MNRNQERENYRLNFPKPRRHNYGNEGLRYNFETSVPAVIDGTGRAVTKREKHSGS